MSTVSDHIFKRLKVISYLIGISLIIFGFPFKVNAAENSTASIKTHYVVSSGSLTVLGQRIEQELLSTRSEEEDLEDETVESFMPKLTTREFSRMITRYAGSLSVEQAEAAISGDMEPYYKAFVEGMSPEDFASIYRQFLGQITVDFVNRPADLTTQDFIQYLLSSVLDLSEEEYSNLFRDYITSLWSFYISSASEQELSNLLDSNEELEKILGEDYSESLATGRLNVDHERYFDTFNQYITSLTDEEFIDTYNAYVTETIGVMLQADFGEILSGGSAEVIPAPNPAEIEFSSESEGSESDNSMVVDSVTATNNAGLIQQFDELSETDSLRLLRQHIAITGIEHFVIPFIDSFGDSTIDYTNVLQEQLSNFKNDRLASLLAIEAQFLAYVEQSPSLPGGSPIALGDDFLEEIDGSQMFVANVMLQLLSVIEEINVEKQNFTNLELAILDPNFLLDVRQQLRLIENIEYPNLRLLFSSTLTALENYTPGSNVEEAQLTDWQFLFLVNAVMDSIETIEGNNLLSDAIASSTNEIWDFLGCGCDIEEGNVIYGFYPTHSLPTTMERQEIDLRFYDRIAYYGLTLGANGDVSDDALWATGGVMNEFISKAHLRNTRVDLAIYSPNWNEFSHDKIEIASANIVDKLSIPLDDQGLISGRPFSPVGPTVSEVITRDTMGDGVTLYFNNLEDPYTGEVRELNKIIDLVTELADNLDSSFGADTTPINLMLDFKTENTEEVLQELRSILVGTDERPDHFVSRILVFLEQDTLNSSQNLLQSVRSVFDDGNSASIILRKINPILIPAMDQDGRFSSLASDLRGLRALFGVNGGAGIWPLPLGSSTLEPEEGPSGSGEVVILSGDTVSDPAEIDRKIEAAFLSAMVDDTVNTYQRGVRTFYFPHRQLIIFLMTLFSLLSFFAYSVSIFEPTNKIILGISRWVGVYILFFLMLSLKIWIDPYISWWRVAFFLAPILVWVIAGSFQHSAPSVSVNLSGNKYLSRQLKRQKSRGLRRVRTKIYRSMRNLTSGSHGA